MKLILTFRARVVTVEVRDKTQAGDLINTVIDAGGMWVKPDELSPAGSVAHFLPWSTIIMVDLERDLSASEVAYEGPLAGAGGVQ